MDFLLILSILIVPVAYSCFFMVKEKTVVPVEMFGKFSFMATAGLNVKLPWPIMSTRSPMSLQVIQIKDRVSVKSSDNAFVSMPFSVQYHVHEGRLYEAYYSLDNPKQQITQYITNVIRSGARDLNLDELFGQKTTIEDSVKETLEVQMREFGFQIRNVLVDEPELSEDLQRAYNDVKASERRKEAASNDAVAKRTLMEGEAAAEGESLVIKAKKYQEQRDLLATGAKEAFDTLRAAIPGVTDNRLLTYLEGIDAREAMQNAASNPATIIITGNGVGDSTSQNEAFAEIVSMLTALKAEPLRENDAA